MRKKRELSLSKNIQFFDFKRLYISLFIFATGIMILDSYSISFPRCIKSPTFRRCADRWTSRNDTRRGNQDRRNCITLSQSRGMYAREINLYGNFYSALRGSCQNLSLPRRTCKTRWKCENAHPRISTCAFHRLFSEPNCD